MVHLANMIKAIKGAIVHGAGNFLANYLNTFFFKKLQYPEKLFLNHKLKSNTMKKEIDNISWEDATIIVSHFCPDHNTMANTKSKAREILRDMKIGVLDALILVEKQKSSQPKHKTF